MQINVFYSIREGVLIEEGALTEVVRYLRNLLRYNKSVYIFLHPFLKSFQLKQEFFKFGDKISWYLQKS